MFCEAEIGLDEADLFVPEVLVEHCLVIAHEVITDIGQIEHTDSQCDICHGIFLLEHGLYGLLELLFLTAELDEELVEDLLALYL